MKKLSMLASLLCCLGVITSCDSSKGQNSDVKMDSNNSSQAVIENIMTRASIRQFTDQPVSKDTLDLVVKAGMAAPSAVNAQPWAFVVITDKAVLDSINSIPNSHFNLKTATAAIVVCGDLGKALPDKGQEYWVQDCSAVTENILLAAHAYGLGAVWCGVYPVEDRVNPVSQILNLPDSIVPLNVITMGYPAENPEPKDKFKQENIHYQKW